MGKKRLITFTRKNGTIGTQLIEFPSITEIVNGKVKHNKPVELPFKKETKPKQRKKLEI